MATNVRSLNKVILIGRVGRDPEIRHIPGKNQNVANFSIATSEGYMDNSNQWQESTEWHNIVAWGYTAQKVERSVGKGTLVMVEGKIKTRKWQDKNGQDRYTTEILADSIIPLERKDAQGAVAQSYGSGGQQNNYQNQQGQQYNNNQGFNNNNNYSGQGYDSPIPEAQVDGDPYDGGSDPF